MKNHADEIDAMTQVAHGKPAMIPNEFAQACADFGMISEWVEDCLRKTQELLGKRGHPEGKKRMCKALRLLGRICVMHLLQNYHAKSIFEPTSTIEFPDRNKLPITPDSQGWQRWIDKHRTASSRLQRRGFTDTFRLRMNCAIGGASLEDRGAMLLKTEDLLVTLADSFIDDLSYDTRVSLGKWLEQAGQYGLYLDVGAEATPSSTIYQGIFRRLPTACEED